MAHGDRPPAPTPIASGEAATGWLMIPAGGSCSNVPRTLGPYDSFGLIMDARALLESLALALCHKLARNCKSLRSPFGTLHSFTLSKPWCSLPDIRLVARKEHSLPMVAALKPWFGKQLPMISSGSTLAEDIRYALDHWQEMTRFRTRTSRARHQPGRETPSGQSA